MKKIAHYIITRFNLRGEAGSKAAIDPEWLGRRFDLLEKFCLPTIRAQTRSDFSWLVLFDTETPPVGREKIERLAQWPTFQPVFFPPGTEDVGRLAIEAVMHEPPDILVTTRLDNDDGLALRYVELVRDRCEIQEPTVFQFPVGYVWCDGKLYRDRQESNPFLTLAEPLTGGRPHTFQTIYTGAHHESHRLGRVVSVSDEPGWLQVVHGGNLANRRRGIRTPAKELQGRFGFETTWLDTREGALGLLADAARTSLIETARSLWHRIH